MTHSTHRSRLSTAFAVAVLAATASAQTTTPTTPTTTTTPCPSTTAPVVQSFSVENALAANQVLATATPKFPANVLAGIGTTPPALELRQFATYNADNQLLTLNLFTVQPGAALPTPTGTIAPNSIFSILSIKVDKVYSSCTPNASLMFVGTIATNTPASPFGNLTGAPAAVSLGLTNDNPPKLTNLATLIAGTVVEYAASGGGSVTFTAGAVTPPGSGGGPTVVATAPDLVAFRIVDLDASGTTGGTAPLTYQWTVVAGAASVSNNTSAKATANILGGAGTYTFRVTVTDAKGNVATKDVNVQFL
jgi:hypothetical protein